MIFKHFSNVVWIAALFLPVLAACGSSGSSFQEDDDPQSLRAEVIRNFFENEKTAVNKYKPLFSSVSSQDGRVEVIKKLASSGQLMIRDPANSQRYYSYVEAYLRDQDAEIRSIAVAALAGASDERSLSQLFEGLKDSSELVRIEALGALRYRYDDAMADPDQTKIVWMKRKASGFCDSVGASKSKFQTEFCVDALR